MVVLSVPCPVCRSPMERVFDRQRKKWIWICQTCKSARRKRMSIAEGFSGTAPKPQEPRIIKSARPQLTPVRKPWWDEA